MSLASCLQAFVEIFFNNLLEVESFIWGVHLEPATKLQEPVLAGHYLDNTLVLWYTPQWAAGELSWHDWGNGWIYNWAHYITWLPRSTFLKVAAVGLWTSNDAQLGLSIDFCFEYLYNQFQCITSVDTFWDHLYNCMVGSYEWLSVCLSGFTGPTLCTTTIVNGTELPKGHMGQGQRSRAQGQRPHGSRSNKGSKQRQLGSHQRQVVSLFLTLVTLLGIWTSNDCRVSLSTGSYWLKSSMAPFGFAIWASGWSLHSVLFLSFTDLQIPKLFSDWKSDHY